MNEQITAWKGQIAKSTNDKDKEGLKYLIETTENQIKEEIEAQKRQRTLRIVYNVLRSTNIEIEKKFNDSKAMKEAETALKKAIEDKKSADAKVKENGDKKYNEIMAKLDPRNDPATKTKFEEILTKQFENYGVTEDDIKDDFFMIRMKIVINAIVLVKKKKLLDSTKEVSDAT